MESRRGVFFQSAEDEYRIIVIYHKLGITPKKSRYEKPQAAGCHSPLIRRTSSASFFEGIRESLRNQIYHLTRCRWHILDKVLSAQRLPCFRPPILEHPPARNRAAIEASTGFARLNFRSMIGAVAVSRPYLLRKRCHLAFMIARRAHPEPSSRVIFRLIKLFISREKLIAFASIFQKS